MSKILEKIGRIKDPFAHDVMAGYAAAVVEEVGEAQGPLAQSSLIERVVQDHLLPGISPAMLKRHIFTPHAWINVALYMVFNQLGGIYLKDGSLFHRLGARVLRPTRLQTQAARFFSLKTIYAMVGILNGNFNNALHMGVWERRRFRPEILLYRKSRDSYRQRVLDLVEDEELLRQWLSVDCQVTRGVLENVSLLLGKERAAIEEEAECEGDGGQKCLYLIRWRKDSLASWLRKVWEKVITFDHHWELKHQVKVMDATIKERVSSLEATQKELEIVNQGIEEMSRMLIQAEKRRLEQYIMGGFAHEMRNSLTGAQLDLKRMADYGQTGRSVGAHIALHLEGLFSGIDALARECGLPKARVGQVVVPHVEAINSAAERLDKMVGGVDEDLQRALAITAQVASYANMAKERPGNQPVDIVEVVSSVASRHREEMESARIALELQLPERLVVSGSRVHFYSIFDNLMRNAIKAVKKAGHPSGVIEIRHFPASTVHIVKIRDSGAGISLQEPVNIFDPFVTDGDGMGMGLAVVKRLADLYEWRVEVDSSPGQGTVFTMVIPGSAPARQGGGQLDKKEEGNGRAGGTSE